MPLVIDEVVIRAKIATADNEYDGGGGGSSPEEKQQMVQACVEEVIRIMESKQRP